MKKRLSTIRRVLALLAMTIALSFAQPLTARAQNESPNIEMQAESQRQVTPDEIHLSIAINESDYKGKKRLQELQDAMIGVLKRNRIDIPEALTLDYMGSIIDYKTFSKQVVPRSQATYMLKLSDAGIMQKIIHELEEQGITNIRLTETRYTKEDAILTELGVEAMKKAQAQASAYAAAVGQSIGKAIRISSWSTSSSPQPRLYKNRTSLIAEETSADGSDAIQPQMLSISKLTYTVHVNVKFELK